MWRLKRRSEAAKKYVNRDRHCAIQDLFSGAEPPLAQVEKSFSIHPFRFTPVIEHPLTEHP